MREREISLVEFASGRQEFNPKEWIPHPYGRRVGIHPKGHPGFKNTRTGRVIPALPPGYVLEGKKVYHEEDRPLVTVTPPHDERGRARPSDRKDPEHILLALPRLAFTDRKVRLALVALAENAARQTGHTLDSDAVAHVHRVVDTPPLERLPLPLLQQVAGQLADRDANVGDHQFYLLASLGHYAPGLFRGMAGLDALRHAVRSTSVPDQSSKVDVINSVFYPHDETKIPLSRQIRQLARAAYDTSDRDTMHVLADALEDKNAPPEVLANLRNPHSAVRGNWVLDAILNKR